MRVLLLYYPRSGSTSILRYYEKIRPDYKIINGPWSPLVSHLEERIKITYNEIVEYKDVFVKSTIPLFLSKNIPFENVKRDFDKVAILIRRNKEEQIESYVMAAKNKSFLDFSPTNYWVDGYDDDNTRRIRSEIEPSEEVATILKEKLNAPMFYYEDLYYDSFDPLFKHFEIEKNEEYFNEFLDRGKKYRASTLETKNNKTLL